MYLPPAREISATTLSKQVISAPGSDWGSALACWVYTYREVHIRSYSLPLTIAKYTPYTPHPIAS